MENFKTGLKNLVKNEKTRLVKKIGRNNVICFNEDYVYFGETRQLEMLVVNDLNELIVRYFDSADEFHEDPFDSLVEEEQIALLILLQKNKKTLDK